MTVIAPFIEQVGRAENYISLEEVKFSPTASSLDLADLVAEGAQAAQDRALYEMIVRASSKIDAYCVGRYGTLNATSSTENGRYKIDRQGRFKIHPSFTPVISVSDFQWGTQMGSLYDLTLSTSNCWVERESIIIQAQGAASVNSISGMQALGYIVGQPYNGEYFCQWTYINGWPNSFTTTSTAAGATSLVLSDPTGIYPNTDITVWDGMNDEYRTVTSTYVPGTPTVDFTEALTYKHGIGVNVSALPATVKQACIHLVVSMVKERGQGGGFEISPAGEVVNSTSGKSKGFSDDEMQAFDLLDEFKVTWGRM